MKGGYPMGGERGEAGYSLCNIWVHLQLDYVDPSGTLFRAEDDHGGDHAF